MSIFPILKSGELIKALLKAGFKVLRQSGSHIRLRHFQDFTRQTTVPIHKADIPRWLLREILRQAKISVKEHSGLLERRK